MILFLQEPAKVWRGSLALPFPFCFKHNQLLSLGLEARRAGGFIRVAEIFGK